MRPLPHLSLLSIGDLMSLGHIQAHRTESNGTLYIPVNKIFRPTGAGDTIIKANQAGILVSVHTETTASTNRLTIRDGSTDSSPLLANIELRFISPWIFDIPFEDGLHLNINFNGNALMPFYLLYR